MVGSMCSRRRLLPLELIAGRWLIDLFGLPTDSSVGFVTGGTMANFTALAAARHALFRKLDWDVEEQGLIGAPEITVVTERRVTRFNLCIAADAGSRPRPGRQSAGG